MKAIKTSAIRRRFFATKQIFLRTARKANFYMNLYDDFLGHTAKQLKKILKQ